MPEAHDFDVVVIGAGLTGMYQAYKLREAGFDYRYTSAGTVRSFARANNLRRATGGSGEEYRYEQDVEQFFRHSPSVVRGVDA